jgi:hypothetical protein
MYNVYYLVMLQRHLTKCDVRHSVAKESRAGERISCSELRNNRGCNEAIDFAGVIVEVAATAKWNLNIPAVFL